MVLQCGTVARPLMRRWRPGQRSAAASAPVSMRTKKLFWNLPWPSCTSTLAVPAQPQCMRRPGLQCSPPAPRLARTRWERERAAHRAQSAVHDTPMAAAQPAPQLARTWWKLGAGRSQSRSKVLSMGTQSLSPGLQAACSRRRPAAAAEGAAAAWAEVALAGKRRVIGIMKALASRSASAPAWPAGADAFRSGLLRNLASCSKPAARQTAAVGKTRAGAWGRAGRRQGAPSLVALPSAARSDAGALVVGAGALDGAGAPTGAGAPSGAGAPL